MTVVAEGQGSISIEIGLGSDPHVGSDSKEEVEASAGLDPFTWLRLKPPGFATHTRRPRQVQHHFVVQILVRLQR